MCAHLTNSQYEVSKSLPSNTSTTFNYAKPQPIVQSMHVASLYLFIYIYIYIGYRSYGSQTWSITWNAVSSKQRLCRYCYMDAQHGLYLNGWRKSLTATTQECCEQHWAGPGGNTPQSSSYTATYHPSRKLCKLDKPDMQDTAGEVETSS